VANTQRMIIDNQGFIGLGVDNPDDPIDHSSGAHLTAGGTWQSVSSRAATHDIQPLAAEEALAAFASLQPVRFYYNAEPGNEYLGFIAEDVPELVAGPDRKTLGSMDMVALLTKVVQHQEQAIAELQAELAALKQQKP